MLTRREIQSAYHNGYQTDPEDAACNAVEKVILRGLEKNPENTLRIIEETCVDPDEPMTAAGMFRVMGWLKTKPGTPGWRSDLLRAGLSHWDLRVRDNTMELIEQWEEEGMDLLRQHEEGIDYLAKYQREIILQHDSRKE